MSCDKWLNKLGMLNVYRAKGGKAPHKPLLLLVAIELAAAGKASSAILTLSPELAFHFISYWRIVAHRRTQRPDIRLPFYHIASDGFWITRTADGTPAKSYRDCKLAEMDASFAKCLSDHDFRHQARYILIRNYFTPEEQAALCAMLGITPTSEMTISDVDQQKQSIVERGREAKFRLTVVPAYEYRCALTRYRLTTISAGSIVDAAHIHRFANSRNNDPDNGIALSKNAHWLFDNGLWTIDEDYRVVVAGEAFVEDGFEVKLLKEYHGQQILLPNRHELRPNSRHLDWHRRRVFVGSQFDT